MSKRKPELAPHKTCRPPKEALAVVSDAKKDAKLWRLGEDGSWRADNMSPGRAFIGALADDPSTLVIWIHCCKCKTFEGCVIGETFKFIDDRDLGQVSIVQYRRART